MNDHPVMFPIIHDGILAPERVLAIREAGQCFAVVAIPWEMIAPHARRAASNHAQDLTTLARRGGLSVCEAVAVLENRKWHSMSPNEANKRLGELVLQFCGAGILT